MNKSFEKKVSEQLPQLRVYEPDDTCWDSIEKSLDADDAISRTLDTLPVYNPDNELWNSISEKLDPAPRLPLKKTLPYIAVASVIILFIAIARFISLNQIRVEDEYFTFSENRETLVPVDDPLSEIQGLCRNGAPVCSSEAFKGKINFYRELLEEEHQLLDIKNKLGGSPEITRSLIKIENLKSEVIQEIILLMHS